MVRGPKTVAHKNHPKNIVSKEKHTHGIVLALYTKAEYSYKAFDSVPHQRLLQKFPPLEFTERF